MRPVLSSSVTYAVAEAIETACAARHHSDTPAVSIGRAETAFGRGHRLHLRQPLSDGGLSNFSKLK